MPRSERVALWSLSEHDLVALRNLVRNLYRVGLVEVDQTATRMLETDEQEYLRGMEGIYRLGMTVEWVRS